MRPKYHTTAIMLACQDGAWCFLSATETCRPCKHLFRFGLTTTFATYLVKLLSNSSGSAKGRTSRAWHWHCKKLTCIRPTALTRRLSETYTGGSIFSRRWLRRSASSCRTSVGTFTFLSASCLQCATYICMLQACNALLISTPHMTHIKRLLQKAELP